MRQNHKPEAYVFLQDSQDLSVLAQQDNHSDRNNKFYHSVNEIQSKSP